MNKEYVIPVFVPHLGCPNDCIFCNQRSISGQQKMITKDDVHRIEQGIQEFTFGQDILEVNTDRIETEFELICNRVIEFVR